VRISPIEPLAPDRNRARPPTAPEAHLPVHMSKLIDILMITYNRPFYTRLALPRLLETCDDTMRVWLWHNGTDSETLDVIHEFREHPRIYRFHHSTENQRLRTPTNWLWSESDAAYFSKVDDDCLVPENWGQILRSAHENNPELGVIGSWRFQDEDLLPTTPRDRVRQLDGGHNVLLNLWVEGSGYLMKRRCAEEQGPLLERQSFPQYCIQLARRGYVNGWHFPLLYQEHMDDPRTPHTLLKTDADLALWAPLTVQTFGIQTLDGWTRFIREDARYCQRSSLNPRDYSGFRLLRRRAWRKTRRRIQRLLGRL